MYEIYIKESISSSIRLFADDCVVYNTISAPCDAEQLQDDLNHIYAWSEKWQMKLNTDKCVLLRCTRSLTPVQYMVFSLLATPPYIGGGSSWKLRGLAMHSEISLHARAHCRRVYIVTVATHYK